MSRALIAAALLFSSIYQPVWAADALPADRVLVIYGSSDIGEWEQIYNSEILRLLADGYQFEVIPEFLSLIGASEQRQEILAESLHMKFGNPPAKLVISVAAEAGSFVRRWSPRFAPDALRLYVRPGTDILSAENLPQSDYLLKSAVEVAAEKTLQLMATLLPELTNIYVVGGVGEGDLSYARSISAAAQTSGVDAEIEFVQGLLADELPAALRNIPATSAIVIATYDSNRLGQPERLQTVTGLLEDSLNVPIFALFDTQVGRGAVGGNVSTTALYAEGTASLARQILTGEAVAQINTAPTRYIFDGTRLDAFDINRRLLPTDSTVTNEAADFIGQNLPWIIAASVVICAQLVLIAMLLRAISQRRQAEEELKTTQKMEALGSLAGGIAHDFNNILMVIMANAELAKSSISDATSADQRLGNILSASNRAKGLISQILLFSRQSAAQNFDPVAVDVMLAESVEQLGTFLPKDCRINLTSEPDLPLVMADTNQLHQAIMNLCINAQHAMNNQGEINIHAQALVIDRETKIFNQLLPPGNYVAIRIMDTGVGIEEANMPHVFEPFFTTKLQGKGTGLGLALVYRIIRAHDGFIDLQSEPGSGSAFTIYLKASGLPEPEVAEESTSQSHHGNGERILLVDDDDMVLDSTRRTLEKLNYKVRSFSSSLEALEAFKENPQHWDLIFTDLSMPEMDGVRLSTQARQIRKDIRIIIYTGYLDAVDGIDLENLRILRKPSQIDEIASAVGSVLRNSES